MLWIVCAFAVFGFFFGILDAILYWNTYKMDRVFDVNATYNFSSIIFAIACLAIVMFGIYVLAVLISDEKKSDGGDDTDDLVSIRTNHGFSGAGGVYIVLVEEKDVYSYFCKRQDGSLHRETIEAEASSIHEEEVCTRPRVVKHKTIVSYNHPILTGFLAFGVHGSDDCTYSYDIFVPKGTIVRSYRQLE